MTTAQKHKHKRTITILLFAILLNGLLFCSFQSEVIIGKANLGNEEFLNYNSIVIDNQLYWVDKSNNERTSNEEMAYVYSYNVFIPKLKVVTKIRPLDN